MMIGYWLLGYLGFLMQRVEKVEKENKELLIKSVVP